eukprot:TRINITY_DN10020_c0_g1_i1.p1 TRINITY_DN10020_c0_g1~~TRINITY_DN10020_c0_g1_i1.p1  ORF type:complete len:328 (+),score=50.13 TRINITY_DN10020_c0_g1_i1:137-1120(+)
MSGRGALRTPVSLPPPPQEDRSVSGVSACPLESGEQLRGSVAAIVESVAVANACFLDDLPDLEADVAALFSSGVPRFSFTEYAKALSASGRDDSWLAALILADRCCRASGCALTAMNMHRLLFSGLLLAVKLHVDCRRVSKAMSLYGKLGLDDTHRMERSFLRIVDWSTFIGFQEYEAARLRLGSVEAAASMAAVAASAAGGRVGHFPLLPDPAELAHLTAQLTPGPSPPLAARPGEAAPREQLTLTSPKGSTQQPPGTSRTAAGRWRVSDSHRNSSSTGSEAQVMPARAPSRSSSRGSARGSDAMLQPHAGSSSARRGSPAVSLRR